MQIVKGVECVQEILVDEIAQAAFPSKPGNHGQYGEQSGQDTPAQCLPGRVAAAARHYDAPVGDEDGQHKRAAVLDEQRSAQGKTQQQGRGFDEPVVLLMTHVIAQETVEQRQHQRIAVILGTHFDVG